MPEKLERLARPSSALEDPGVVPARGINRGHLTLYLSIAAIILSVASAGVHLFVFQAGERPKMAAETELARILRIKEEALARAAQLEVALKAQQIKTSEAQEQEARAGKVDHLAAAQNHHQDSAKKAHETVSAEREAAMRKGIVTPALIEQLSRSAAGAAGVPNASPRGLFDDPIRYTGRMPPIASGAPGNLGPASDQYDPNDPFKKRGPIK